MQKYNGPADEQLVQFGACDLTAGKKADFALLNEDPLTSDRMAMRDLNIHATVFEDRVFELQVMDIPITIVEGSRCTIRD